MYYGEKIRLRALELDDLDIILKYWNHVEIRRYLGSMIPMSRKAEQEWLERATVSNPWKDGSFVLAIEEKETCEFLGTISLFDISKQNRHAEFGIAIHNPENLSKGYGTDATQTMLWIGFHVLGLNNIYLYALVGNKRAIRSYEKAGFKKIGVFRKMTYSMGKFQDLVAMDILSEEFLEKFPPGTQTG
ncbi:MAG: GNAT family N-acetyltransferase [Candidatus Thorarchaeota archaeon]